MLNPEMREIFRYQKIGLLTKEEAEAKLDQFTMAEIMAELDVCKTYYHNRTAVNLAIYDLKALIPCRAYVFGSVAKGTATTGSDIDVLVTDTALEAKMVGWNPMVLYNGAVYMLDVRGTVYIPEDFFLFTLPFTIPLHKLNAEDYYRFYQIKSLQKALIDNDAEANNYINYRDYVLLMAEKCNTDQKILDSIMTFADRFLWDSIRNKFFRELTIERFS